MYARSPRRAAGLLGAEKKYGIAQKYQVAGLSGTQIYLARFIPMVICVLSCVWAFWTLTNA